MSSYLKRLRFYYSFLFVYFVFHVIFFTVLKSYDQETHNNALKIVDIYKKLLKELHENAELDNSGLYKIVEAKKSETLILHDITIVTQCSSNYFLLLESLFKTWKGPISVAVFSEADSTEYTLWDMARFIHCNHQRDFAMQLVVPVQDAYVKDFKFVNNLLFETEKSISCNSAYFSTQNGKKNYEWTFPYPVNLLRNVAKERSTTDYIFVIDVDMVPNVDLRNDFLNFIKIMQSNSDKIVYVVPAFEIVPGTEAPEDKTELIRLINLAEARPFYVVPCDNCQKLTKYDDWLKNDNTIGIDVLFEVEWKHPWEPFFIAKRDIPNFDERFRQYGMNRVSQVCELHVAGYKFLVLDNAFLVHKGFKNEEDFHDSKNQEMELNRKVYTQFKIEVMYKYPESVKSC